MMELRPEVPGLRVFRNEIDSVLRQDQTHKGTSLLAFKVVAEKTGLPGCGERSRPSGVIYSAASPIREVIYLEAVVEKQENGRISNHGSLQRICGLVQSPSAGRDRQN
jgi:hypothetical protein